MPGRRRGVPARFTVHLVNRRPQRLDRGTDRDRLAQVGGQALGAVAGRRDRRMADGQRRLDEHSNPCRAGVLHFLDGRGLADAGRHEAGALGLPPQPLHGVEQRRRHLQVHPVSARRRGWRPGWDGGPHIAAVLAEIPAGSVTRVRLELMHWTGMRPSQMGRLRAEDFRLDEPIPYVAVPRGKGGRIPLVPEGFVAARAFLDAGAFGSWPRSSVNRALARAARRAGRPAFTTYQIRHSFAAGLRRAGTDVADIQDLYGHTRPETTMIYAPPELAKHRAALERLRRTDGNGAPAPADTPVLAAAGGWQDSA